ncbi:hypothetical protein MKX83_24030 [Cytobacillus sp. FSL M8-0252]|uniref:hypothetical protein n=1 Tax=Cytobacillus sp. FSL M8-0252 TaxID=2921621 RepID=UPI0030F53068
MNDSLKVFSKKIISMKNWFLIKRDIWINKKMHEYNESFLRINNREPNEVESKHYKKNLVMGYGMVVYLPIATILFIFIAMLRGE